MASTTDEGPVLDTAMEQDEDMAQGKVDQPKATYKSFKKKYRKMRIKFDETMSQSNKYFNQERKAMETAKRLKQQNDQLLDLLLDVNESAQIPVDKRIDLTTDIPALSPIPPLVSNDDLENAAELQTPEGQALYNEIRTMISEKASSSDASKPLKSLAALMAATPHLSASHPNLPSETMTSLEPEEGQKAPLAYLTADQLEDYLYDIDASLGIVPPLAPPNQTPQHDLTFGNFHSPYNWLRRNVPQIFLQDGESSEKSHGKPGALRGAGKRASIPAPSKPDALEFVEEDGIGYDAALGGPVHTKGKRKREEDDGGYHPSKGSRGTGESKAKKPRKKKSDESTPTTSGRKGKGRGKQSSPAPDANPFGPI
ncbi:IEC3 subunit of the Ino80 complex, chromatin re-modelling domain containing protein [Hyaloscypha variabilis]